MQIGGSERRVDRRYHVELPLRVMWRDLDGKSCEAEGLAKDISRTGIFFVVPTVIRADEPVQLELVLPDEITQRGELRIRFVARPVRQERVGNALREETPGVAVAAALEITGEGPPLPLASPRARAHAACEDDWGEIPVNPASEVMFMGSAERKRRVCRRWQEGLPAGRAFPPPPS